MAIPPPAVAPTAIASAVIGAAAVRVPPGPVWLVAVAAAIGGALAPTPWWQLGVIAAAVLASAALGRIRAPALRFGLVAALVFVAIRVAYRVIFTSTAAPPENAVLLLDLPVIPLAGPLRGIALLGPLTLDQLIATLVDASRFAAVFVVFGAANAIADARTLLARAPRPFLPLATVLALALGAVPALIASVQRVDRAARMRGEKRGPRLLVPVLEQAVERATTLAASMELRGFPVAGRPAPPSAPAPIEIRQSAATGPFGQRSGGSRRERRGADVRRDQGLAPGAHPDDPCGELLLRAEGLTVTHGAAPHRRDVLSGAGLELRAGEMTLITGPTGSGKSTLLRALAGLAPAYTGGRVTGALEVNGLPVLGRTAPGELRPARLSGFVALVPQRVEHSFLAETVAAELAFAPSRRGVSGSVLDAIVREGLERFGLTGFEARDPATLSAGEATRAGLAAACIAGPRVLLLDEPIADLDPHSVAAVLDALRQLLAEGCAVLVAEHRPEQLAAIGGDAPIRRFEMRDGTLRPATEVDAGEPQRIEPEAEASVPVSRSPQAPAPEPSSQESLPYEPPEQQVQAPPNGESILLARALSVEHDGRELVRVDELAVRTGEIVVLTGPNGSGKTSLLESIALPPGATRRTPGMVLVPQRVDDLLIRDTLADECRFADHRAGAVPGATAHRFGQLVAESIPEAVRQALPGVHPRDLSAGTRLALGIAVQLAHRPRVLLLDEPTRGLDSRARRRLAAMLAALAVGGTAVLLTTHDTEFPRLLREEGAPLRALGLVRDGAAEAEGACGVCRIVEAPSDAASDRGPV